MVQNFDFPELNQYGKHKGTNPPHGQDHTACSTPNPPWWCREQAPSVNIDIYAPMLMLIAVAIGLIKLQNFKLKINGK